MAVWGIRLAGTICIVVTFLPLLKTGYWFIRGWDFPRFHIAIVLLALVLVACISHGKFTNTPEFVIWLTLMSVACVWQASHVIQFTPIWPIEVENTPDNRVSFRLLVVNLAYENTAYDAVIAEIRAVCPELLVLIEIDQRWSAEIAELRSDYAFHHDEVRDAGLGISLWSKLPVLSAESRCLIEDRRPSIWAEVEWHAATINLVALHPTPPGLDDSTGETRRNSRVRDAELVTVARRIAERKTLPWVVVGDFNDVAWSHTTRLFKRLSGLRDPRVGRSFMGTYPASFPLRFPIDHVFLSNGFTISRLTQQRVTGSDHLGVLAELAVAAPSTGVCPESEVDDHLEAKDMVKEGRADAQQRGVGSHD